MRIKKPAEDYEATLNQIGFDDPKIKDLEVKTLRFEVSTKNFISALMLKQLLWNRGGKLGDVFFKSLTLERVEEKTTLWFFFKHTRVYHELTLKYVEKPPKKQDDT